MRVPITHEGAEDAGAEALALDASDETWSRMHEMLGESVFRMLHRLTGDKDLAEDLTQEAFVRAYEQRDRFDGRGSVRGWVHRIALNLAKQQWRRAMRRRDLLRLREPSPCFRKDPSSAVEARLVLERALAALPPDQRASLLLFEVDGYSHAEIAAMFGIEEGSSRARVARAKAALREAMGELR